MNTLYIYVTRQGHNYHITAHYYASTGTKITVADCMRTPLEYKGKITEIKRTHNNMTPDVQYIGCY